MAVWSLLLIVLCAHYHRKEEGKGSLAMCYQICAKLLLAMLTFLIVKWLFRCVANTIYAFMKCPHETLIGQIIAGFKECLHTVLQNRGNVLVLRIKKVFAIIKLILLSMDLVISCAILKTLVDLLIECNWASIRILIFPVVKSFLHA